MFKSFSINAFNLSLFFRKEPKEKIFCYRFVCQAQQDFVQLTYSNLVLLPELFLINPIN
jgi:hypothetical protein